MFDKNFLEYVLNKKALRRFEKQKDKERPVYGIVVDINLDYDENGNVAKVNDVIIAYLLNGQLCTVIIPAEKVILNESFIVPGVVVKFCSEQLNNDDLPAKINSAYILKVDRQVRDSFPQEVYKIAKKYMENIKEDEISPVFLDNLDLEDQEKRKLLLEMK